MNLEQQNYINYINPDALPSPKQEEWKYTNLSKFIPKNLAKDSNTENFVIHKNGGEACGKIEDIVLMGKDGFLQTPQITIELEKGASATLIERHEGQGSYWKNVKIEIVLQEGATLKHYRMLNDSLQSVCTLFTHIIQKENSTYEGFAFLNNAQLTRNEIYASLEGKNSSCSVSGLNLLKDKQHADTTVVIQHRSPECNSNQFFRTILDDEARGVFQGKIHVNQEAQKTDGYQLSNSLMLSKTAEMNTKPELEIYADDVKCSHGSTAGQLEEDALFYLKSRGIEDKKARAMLIEAFIQEVVQSVDEKTVQEDIIQKAQKWLQGVLGS